VLCRVDLIQAQQRLGERVITADDDNVTVCSRLLLDVTNQPDRSSVLTRASLLVQHLRKQLGESDEQLLSNASDVYQQALDNHIIDDAIYTTSVKQGAVCTTEPASQVLRRRAIDPKHT
jgi:hypothetical protein